jgi:hypothetical protein
VKFRQKAKLNFQIFKKKKVNLEAFPSPEVTHQKKKEKFPDSYIRFSLCSQKYKKMIKDL